MTDIEQTSDDKPRSMVDVALGDRAYPIEIGPDLLNQAGEMIRDRLGDVKCAVITDENVALLHLAKLESALYDAGLTAGTLTLSPGEETKGFVTLEWLSQRLLEMEIERGDIVIAFGGGVIGDLAGFAASILRRGVRFVQIPTTLLAQVDSSVGGKTGINTPQGKNLIGAFHQPSMVIIDTNVLDTLPRRELLAGYAEVVKYGLINDPPFFEWLEQNGPALIDGDLAGRIRAIETSCKAKADVVAADEREGGQRALLNLGHTFGHALEAWAGYGGKLIHGEGVAIGMVMAFELSEKLGYCPAGRAERVAAHFRALGMPVSIADIKDETGPSPDELLRHMGQDKKVAGGKLVFIMARDIGQSFIDREVPIDALKAYLAEKC